MKTANKPFDISTIRKGDIIAVKCRVEFDRTIEDKFLFVTPFGGNTTTSVTAEDIYELLGEHLEIGQTVFYGIDALRRVGEVLFLTDTKAVVKWATGEEEFVPRGWLLRDDPAAAADRSAEERAAAEAGYMPVSEYVERNT